MSRENYLWVGILGIVAITSCTVLTFRYLRHRDVPLVSTPPSAADLPPADGAVVAEPRASNGARPVAAVLGSAPQFQLTDQRGDTFGSSQLNDKIWLVNFIFTRCASTCPMQTRVMADLQKLLSASPLWTDIRLLSITVDPEFDRPEVLQDYAASVGADNEHWRFLTGERRQIWELSKEGFRLAVADDPSNVSMPIMHDSKFVLVDRRGQIRGYFDVLSQGGVDALRRALDHVLPEMAISDEAMTHLAQPPEIINNEWLLDRAKAQADSIQKADVFHDFHFHNQAADSGIDFNPQIVDEQRWRLQVNHYDHGNGVAVADVDGDSRLDVYFVAQVGANALYRNLGDGKFENITDRAGVAVVDRIGVTASFADIDNDGDADLFVTTVRGGNLLFENDGRGVFRDIAREAGVDYVGHCSSAVFFDYDRDGRLDLFLSNVGKYTTDEYASVRIDGTSSLPPGDYKYYVGTADAFAGHLKPDHEEHNIFYRNVGGKSFVDVTEEVGLVDDSWSGAALPLDVNQDGWLDLYVLNMQGDDEYYENAAGRRFVRRSREVFPRTPWGAMGGKSFDFDNDGNFDLYITDMHSDMSEDVSFDREKQKSNMQWPEAFLRSTIDKSIFGNAFYHNRGDGQFAEISNDIGAENYWPWGISVGDVNADGFEDVFVAASMCFPYRYAANSLLLNSGGKRFLDSAFVLGIEPRPAGQQLKAWFELDCDGVDRDNPICSGRSGKITVWSARGTRSSVIFDLDEDGDMDIVTSDFNSSPLVFVSDLAQQRPVNYLKVLLRGTESNADGLGAFVSIRIGATTLHRVHDGQSGYLSQSRMPLYFGLGQSNSVDQIEVKWPSGKTQLLHGPIEAWRTLEIVEQ